MDVRIAASTQPRELRAAAAVEEVDEETGDEPEEEAVPGDDGQAGHEQEAEDDAE